MLYFYTMLRILILLVFNQVLLAGSLLNAQTPAYLHYDVSKGLPGNVVYCAAQDERGLMWFGTDKGLACFDGVRFRTYGIKEGLPDPEVLNLKLDSFGRMWVFCFKQKPCYFQHNILYTEKNDPMLSAIEISVGVGDILQDSKKNIWIYGQYNIIYLLKNNSTVIETIPAQYLGSYLIERPSYLLSCSKDRFIKLQKSGGVTGVEVTQNFHALNYQGAGTLQGNKFLMSFTDGTYVLEETTKFIRAGKKILSTGGRVYIDPGKNVWICTTSKGAIRYAASDTLFEFPQTYLANKKVTTAIEDHTKGIWFCTSGQGVYYLPPGFSTMYTQNDGLISDNITTLFHTPEYGMLGGDDQGNIYTFNGKAQYLTTVGSGGLNRCRQIITLPHAKEVFVVSDYGMSVFKNGQTQSLVSNNAGKYILSQKKGWLFGSSNNIYTIPYDAPSQLSLLLNRRTTAAAQDPEGTVWVGGISGLYSSTDSFLTNWGDTFPALKSRILSIKCDETGKIWVATPNFGLLHLTVSNGKVLQAEEVSKNLNNPVENIQSLFPEKNNRIWLATNSGVYGIDDNKNVIHFDKNNGLAEDDVNDILILKDTLWAATVAGLSKIVMTNKTQNNFKTLFSRIRYKLGDHSRLINLLDSLSGQSVTVLPGDASLIELDMAGLDFTSRGNLKYAFNISKQLPDWTCLTFENLFTWIRNRFGAASDSTFIDGNTLNLGVYLAPGRYEFTAKAVNPNGVVSTAPAVCVIHKLPYWYQTAWFYLLIWGTVLMFFWRIFKAALEYRRLQTAVSELSLQAIQTQINPHFIGNSINAIQQFFYPPDPVKASNYISIFTRLLRTTMDFSEKPFVPIGEELAYNEDYLNMIQLRFGQRFRFNFNVDEDISKNTPFPTMILQPILENATIHGLSPDETSILEVNISKNRNGIIECIVTDNGIGLNKSRHTQKQLNRKHKSKGLQLLHRKIRTINELYHTECSLELEDISEISPPDHGTRVILTFNPSKILQSTT